ncbi:MAG TPA: GyrI-like domain-containing protein [Bacteroidales bacterium]|nr:GyrI-like domain-containing protein [Bacteroidales bacterium]
MNLIPELKTMPRTLLAGRHLTMSYVHDRTFELWSSFMPVRKNIQDAVGNNLFSVQVFADDYFDHFNPAREFEKWAAVEVRDQEAVAAGMETLVIPEGLYAVFIHKGPASEGPRTFGYIFQTWLPASGYIADNRPHFEILGEKYRNNDPSSEEEVWIPIRPVK